MSQSQHPDKQHQPPVRGVVPGGTDHGTSSAPAMPITQNQLAYKQPHHHHHQQQEQQLQGFWAKQIEEIERATDFKNHTLPLARIKKIMKADEEVRMISAEAPVIFAKACEILVLELTLRSWIQTEENKRRTLQKSDISAAVSRTDVFDFLVDIIPRDELKEEGLGVTKATIPMPAEYYYPHLELPRPTLAFMPWPHQMQPPQQEHDQEPTDS